MNFIKRGTEEISDRLAAAPGARPDLLFSTPETVGFTHQGVQVDMEDLDITVRQLGISETPYCLNEQMHKLFYLCTFKRFKYSY